MKRNDGVKVCGRKSTQANNRGEGDEKNVKWEQSVVKLNIVLCDPIFICIDNCIWIGGLTALCWKHIRKTAF